MLYDTSDNLKRVELTPSTRRGLAQREQNVAAIAGRRLDFADCNVCANAWGALCAGGRSVCDLVDYGSPFRATASASVEATCENFCKHLTADRACEDQCTGGLCH